MQEGPEAITVAAGRAAASAGARDLAMARLLMAHRHGDAARLVVELRRRGVEPLVLKGVGVQRLLYPDEVRPSCDVDVLVAPADLRAARRALVEAGFTRFGRFGHATAWGSPTRTPVDLHRTLPRSGVSARSAWRLLAQHRTTVDVEGIQVPVLDAAATAVHLTIHLTQGVGERPLEDLRRAVAQLAPHDWRAALGLARQLGTTTSMAWALDQVPGGEQRREELGLPTVARADLPVRTPREAGVARFATSSVHWRERAGALVATAARLGSKRSLATWAGAQGRPVPTTTSGTVLLAGARVRHQRWGRRARGVAGAPGRAGPPLRRGGLDGR